MLKKKGIKMKTYFCSNPLCKKHVDIREVSHIKNFRHRHGYDKPIFLCETCHNAVKMEEQLLTQRKIDIVHRQRAGQFAYVKPNLENDRRLFHFCWTN